MILRLLALAVLISGAASADSLPPQTIKPPGTSAPAAQAVQGVSGGVAVPISGSVTVSSASVTQGTSPWVVSGSGSFDVSDRVGRALGLIANTSFASTQGTSPWVVGQSTAASLNALVAQGAAGASAWKVDGTGGAFPISGNIGNTSFGATQGTSPWVVGFNGTAQPVSWSAQTVTVTQGTGTNLHAVIDSGSTTAVTGNVTVIQGTGSNLHAVIDTGSTTAVTQATGSNLHRRWSPRPIRRSCAGGRPSPPSGRMRSPKRGRKHERTRPRSQPPR